MQEEKRFEELIDEVRGLIEKRDQLSAAISGANDIAELVGHYVGFRDKKEELKRFRTELESGLDAFMESIENRLLQVLDASGQESAKTKFGTAYKKKSTSTKVADWNVLIGYVKENDAYDILTKSVAKDAVKQRIEETGEPVPGVDLVTWIEVGIRRA